MLVLFEIDMPRLFCSACDPLEAGCTAVQSLSITTWSASSYSNLVTIDDHLVITPSENQPPLIFSSLQSAGSITVAPSGSDVSVLFPSLLSTSNILIGGSPCSGSITFAVSSSLFLNGSINANLFSSLCNLALLQLEDVRSPEDTAFLVSSGSGQIGTVAVNATTIGGVYMNISASLEQFSLTTLSAREISITSSPIAAVGAIDVTASSIGDISLELEHTSAKPMLFQGVQALGGVSAFYAPNVTVNINNWPLIAASDVNQCQGAGIYDAVAQTCRCWVSPCFLEGVYNATLLFDGDWTIVVASTAAKTQFTVTVLSALASMGIPSAALLGAWVMPTKPGLTVSVVSTIPATRFVALYNVLNIAFRGHVYTLVGAEKETALPTSSMSVTVLVGAIVGLAVLVLLVIAMVGRSRLARSAAVDIEVCACDPRS